LPKVETGAAAVLARRARGLARRLLGRAAPRVGRVRWGDLGRASPISRDFGYNRGGPIDRFYIETFLRRHMADVHGHVLEVKDGSYTRLLGGDRVVKGDVLDIDEANPHATIVIDLNDAAALPSDVFDCIILTQTLQLIFSLDKALADLHRSLKPGGVLLLTVPGITPVRTRSMTWYWSFTELAIARLLGPCFPTGATDIVTFGNLRSATAFLYGLGGGELSADQLGHQDPDYPVIIGARAMKSGV
jgi:SAM-dependent methyltransferase